MYDVFSIKTTFIHGLCKSTVAHTATTATTRTTVGRIVIITSCDTASATTDIIVTGGLSRHTHVLEVGIDVTYNVLFGTFAFAFVDDDTCYFDHVDPIHLECLWIAHKYLITVLDGISK